MDGWSVAKYLLEHERGGYSYHSAIDRQLQQIKEWRASEDIADTFIGQNERLDNDLADLEIDKLALQFTEYRLRSMSNRGPESAAFDSLIKVTGNELGQKLDRLALAFRGPYIALEQNSVFGAGF